MEIAISALNDTKPDEHANCRQILEKPVVHSL
jgi:hypothetical protein